jgi:excisionase family DNA binding protein
MPSYSSRTLERKEVNLLKPIAISVAEACKVCGIGKTTLYRMLQDGLLESRLIGRKRVVIVESIERYFDRSV